MSLFGLVILVVTDQGDTTDAKPANPLLGDALVLLAAVLYAANNVAQEKLLGKICVLPSYSRHFDIHAWIPHPQPLRWKNCSISNAALGISDKNDLDSSLW